MSIELNEIRSAVRELCAQFPDQYWRELEPEGYPDGFVRAPTEAGWLGALIPEEYGGGGLSLTQTSVMLEEIDASGGNPGACHAQMYTMGTILRHGSDEQKAKYLPKIASGELRLQAFGVTEWRFGAPCLSVPRDRGHRRGLEATSVRTKVLRAEVSRRRTERHQPRTRIAPEEVGAWNPTSLTRDP